jgi:hypothetical protein
MDEDCTAPDSVFATLWTSGLPSGFCLISSWQNSIDQSTGIGEGTASVTDWSHELKLQIVTNHGLLGVRLGVSHTPPPPILLFTLNLLRRLAAAANAPSGMVDTDLLLHFQGAHKIVFSPWALSAQPVAPPAEGSFGMYIQRELYLNK